MATLKRSSSGRIAEVGRSTSSDQGTWKVPRGSDLRSVTKDASKQVIKNYGDALEKLKKH